MDTKEQSEARASRLRKIDHVVSALADLGLVIEGAQIHTAAMDLDVPAKLADVAAKVRDEARARPGGETTPVRRAAFTRVIAPLDVMCEPERPPPPPPPQ